MQGAFSRSISRVTRNGLGRGAPVCVSTRFGVARAEASKDLMELLRSNEGE